MEVLISVIISQILYLQIYRIRVGKVGSEAYVLLISHIFFSK